MLPETKHRLDLNDRLPPIDIRPPCLTLACDRPSKTRGLCGSCYNTARNLVARDKTTWEELEAMGLIGPRVQRPRQLFAERFEALKGQENRKGGPP